MDISRHVWGVFWACPGHVWATFGACLGRAWGIFGACLGHVPQTRLVLVGVLTMLVETQGRVPGIQTKCPTCGSTFGYGNAIKYAIKTVVFDKWASTSTKNQWLLGGTNGNPIKYAIKAMVFDQWASKSNKNQWF